MLTIRNAFVFKELVQRFNIWPFVSCKETLVDKNINNIKMAIQTFSFTKDIYNMLKKTLKA